MRHIRGQARNCLLEEWSLATIQERRRKLREFYPIFFIVRAIGMISFLVALSAGSTSGGLFF